MSIEEWDWDIQWWPRYTPISHGKSYSSSWHSGRFAKRLAEFIDKVLAATGASKVDIVAHSMGGLVSRVAIKNYGCASKVRKLIMIGTPNHPYSEPELGEWLYLLFSNDKQWQKEGEDLEMGVGVNTDFTDLKTGETKSWHDWLGYENYIEGMATIAGNRKCWLSLGIPAGPDDGVVNVSQVYLSTADFNPVIFASHGHTEYAQYGVITRISASGEYSLTECTFTTEFIKTWLIDDRNLEECPVSKGNPYAYPMYSTLGSIRINPNVDDYGKVFILYVRLFNIIGDPIGEWRVFPLFRGFKRKSPGDPVYLTKRPDADGKYFVYIKVYNMEGVCWEKSGNPVVLFAGDSSYISVLKPNQEKLKSGSTYQIQWKTNDWFVKQKIYYSTDGGVTWIFIDSLGESKSEIIPYTCTYNWNVPIITSTSSNCRIKIMSYLDILTSITGISNKFTIEVPDWRPYNLSAESDEEKIKLTWSNYYATQDSVQIWRKPNAQDENIFGRINKVTDNANEYIDYNVISGNIYTYKLKAWIGNHSSPFSVEILVNAPYLNSPSSLTANAISYSEIRLDWCDNSKKNTKYEIQYKTVAENTWHSFYRQDVEQCTVKNLEPLTKYCFRVRAIDDEGHFSEV